MNSDISDYYSNEINKQYNLQIKPSCEIKLSGDSFLYQSEEGVITNSVIEGEKKNIDFIIRALKDNLSMPQPYLVIDSDLNGSILYAEEDMGVFQKSYRGSDDISSNSITENICNTEIVNEEIRSKAPIYSVNSELPSVNNDLELIKYLSCEVYDDGDDYLSEEEVLIHQSYRDFLFLNSINNSVDNKISFETVEPVNSDIQ